eukprot:tig00001056_g6628.t1
MAPLAVFDGTVLVARGPGQVQRSPRRKPVHVEPIDELAPMDLGGADEACGSPSCSFLIAEMWIAATNGTDVLDLSRYLTLHNALFRALRFEFNAEDAQTVAMTDFAADACGGSVVSPQRFEDMLRSLAKGWTTSESSDGPACAMFLQNLKQAIVAPARPPHSGVSIKPWQYIEPAAGIRWLGLPTPPKPKSRATAAAPRRSALTAALKGTVPEAAVLPAAEEPRAQRAVQPRAPLRHAVRAFGSAPDIGLQLRKFAILNVARRFDAAPVPAAASVAPKMQGRDDVQCSTYPPPLGSARAGAALGEGASSAPLASPRQSEPALPARASRLSASFP